MSEVNKIANYNQMMSWLTRPATPKTQVASAETDALKEQFNEKLGPGVIKTLDELPPIQDPFKNFEDRNPRETAAEGGRANLAIGGGQFEGTDLGTREGFAIIKAGKETRALYNDEKLVEKIIELVKKEPEDYSSVLNKINSYKNNPYKYSQTNLSNVLFNLAKENKIDSKYIVDKTGTPNYVVNKRNAKIDELINVAPDKLPTASSIAKKLNTTTTTVTSYLKKSKGEDWVKQNYGKERFKRYGDIPVRTQFLDYVSNNPVEKFTVDNIIKNTDIKTKKEANSIYSKILTDIYDKRAPNIDRPVLYIDENINLKDLTKKLRSSDDFYDAYERKIGSLLLEAYDGNLDSKEYKKARNTLTAYHNLIRPLNKKYPSIAQTVEHPIPYTFLTEVSAGKDPKNLINTVILGDKENTFKSKIDNVKINLRRNLEKNPKDKKLLAQVEDMKKLETFLTKETGMGFGNVKARFTDPKFKDLDFGAKAFGKKKIVPQIEESLNIRQKTVDFYKKFKNDPTVIKLFENAGVGPRVLRMLGGLRKGNVPLFLKQMNEILNKNPGLKDKLTQLDVFNDDDRILLASLDNQSGTMTDVYTGPKLTTEEKDPLPYEAALPAGMAVGKYGPQILKALKNVGKIGLKTVGSLPAAGTFAGMTIKDNLDEGKNIVDATVDPLVGIELLLPEAVKSLGPLMARAARVSTPIGAGITAAGILKERTQNMMKEAETLTTTPYQEDLIEDYASKSYRGYELGGRVGFADGPEDPDKRKFMKIMGGLASLPIVGRLFDTAQVVEKAAPVVAETIKGVPPYFFRLVEKIKQLGDDVTRGASTQEREVVTSYKDYMMTEDLTTGNIVIRKRNEGVFYDQDGIISDEYMTYNPGRADETNKVKPADEYDEYTVRPDGDGKLTDSEDGLDNLKEIMEEAGDPDSMTLKK